MRKGMMLGRGSGYYNYKPMLAHDRKVHHDAGLGRKQPQRMPMLNMNYKCGGKSEVTSMPYDYIEAEMANMDTDMGIKKWKKGQVLYQWTNENYWKIVSVDLNKGFVKLKKITEREADGGKCGGKYKNALFFKDEKGKDVVYPIKENLSKKEFNEIINHIEAEQGYKFDSEGFIKGGKCGGKKPNVYLEDDGSLDTLKVEKVNAGDVFDDDNEGYKYGLQEIDDDGAGYAEWFKTEKARENAIKKYNMKVIGGKCSPSDLKYGTAPDSQFDKAALKAGIKVETEHTNSRKVAKAIAKAHLKEDGSYYKKLRRMEKGGKNVFDFGEPLYKYQEKTFKGKKYKAVSVDENESTALRSAKDWRDVGYKARVYKANKGTNIVYLQSD